MLFLILSFVCSAILILLFKVFERNGVPIFPAIVINYCTAATCGFIFLPNQHEVTSGAFIEQGWLPLSIVLGMMFITVFNLTSRTAVSFGVSTASVASKLGLVFPVLLAFFVYQENFNWLKLIGIFLAFVAVILCSVKEKHVNSLTGKTSSMFLPFIVFVGSGACDSVTQFANKRYLMHHGLEEFAMFIFVSAGATGICILTWQIVSGKTTLKLKSVVGGICLGIPNYLSFLFLLKALATIDWGSSVIFPITNLGTVTVATIVSFLFFKENISKTNLTGLLIAGAAIALIVLSNFSDVRLR